MIRVLPALTLLLAACDRPAEPPAPPAVAAPQPAAVPAAPAASVPRPASAQAVSIAAETPLLDFSYDWPAPGAAIAKLDGRFRADAETSRRRALGYARDDRADRGTEFPFHQHSFSKDWTVLGDTPNLLALAGETYTFTGGAHGNTGWEFILWDRAADRDITVLSLFADRARALRALTAAFCPALDAAREEKRSAPVDKSDDMFGGCVDLTKQVIVPGDVRGGRFTTIHVLIGPYEAGPYSEGSYDVVLPVTPELLRLMRPEQRGAFAAA